VPEFDRICIEHEIPLNADGTCRNCRDKDGRAFVLDMQSYYLEPKERPQMPEVNGQYAMNPQLAKAAGDQAAQAADTRASAEEAGYLELEGAQKDSDCSTVNVPAGVSSAGGCCNLWDTVPQAKAFSCGTCTKIKGGAPGATAGAAPGNAGAGAADTAMQSVSASPQMS
jgi:hypothetical protein